MSSRRDQITAACVALLQQAGGPAGLNVHRQRTISLTHDQLPAQVVYALQEENDTAPGRGAPLAYTRKAKRKLTLCVEHRVDAENTPPDQALDPLLSWAVQQLCSGVSLGGLAYDLKEIGTKWDEVEQDKVYAAARTLFDVEYVTDASNPDTLTN
jgi:hypothetical protein